MPSIQFSQQNIFTQGDQVTTLYKLVQGSATLLNHDTVIADIRAPYYLNLFQHIYGVPALKTVRVEDKCLVQKIRRPKETHKQILRGWKEQGFRKSKFFIFEELQTAVFYQLLRFGTPLEIRKQKQILAQQGQLYLLANGNLQVSGPHSSLHYLSLSEGEIIVAPNAHTNLRAVSEKVRIMAIPLPIAKALLGSQFKTIQEFIIQQKSAIDDFEVRNNRLSHKIKKDSQGYLNKMNIPAEFVNKAQEKVRKFSKYCGIRSCMGRLGSKSKSQILAENQERFKQLVQLNRKKYGQEYIFNKRMEIGHKVASQSCSLSLKQRNIYDPSTIKQPYAILFSHPLVKQWQKSHSKKTLLRKVAREYRKQEPLFHLKTFQRSTQNNLTFSN